VTVSMVYEQAKLESRRLPYRGTEKETKLVFA
jgi:hypothetical protein